MKQSGYRLVVVTKGFQDYRASFLVKADSPLKSLADLKGNRIGAPTKDSITAWMMRATVRDALGDAARSSTSTRATRKRCRFRREQPDPVRRDRRQCGRQGMDREGRQGADALEAGADQAHHREPSMSAEDVALVRDYLMALEPPMTAGRSSPPPKWQASRPATPPS
jgi:hypothetical protein